MTTHSLLLLPGDGIGLETMAEVERVIAFFNAKSQTAQFSVDRDLVGGSAYDAHGVSITDAAMAKAQKADAIMFGAVSGLTWLSTVPPTSALVALMFGTRWFATLYGFAFVSHQVGGFLGVWLGGIVFEQSGSYTPIWWLSVLFGVLSALINLPIVEAPVARTVPAI